MQQFRLEVSLKTPLLIGDRTADASYIIGREVIPGVALRGALAEFLALSGRQAEIPTIPQRYRFAPLLPAQPDRLSYPCPLSAISCKHNKEHGPWDTLILFGIWHHWQQQYNAHFVGPLMLDCPRCGERTDRYGAAVITRKENRWEKVEVNRYAQTKVAISRARRAAYEGMLYSVSAVSPNGIAYYGPVWCANEDDFHTLCEALEAVGLGALRRRGFGIVKVSKTTVYQQDKTLQERLRDFNRMVAEVWRSLHALLESGSVDEQPDGVYFSITLASPAILTNRQGLPTLKLNLDWADLVFWVTRQTQVKGWHEGWGLPKKTEQAAAAGSAYLFRSSLSEDKTIENLKKIENEGVGLMRNAGFGHVIACHPFHLEVMSCVR